MAKKKSLATLLKESAGKTSHVDMYIVNKSTNKVILDIEIGETGQSGVSKILLDGVSMHPGSPEVIGSIRNLDLGTNKSLIGKSLVVTTVVTDVSKKTNLTSFDFNLTGSTEPFRVVMQRSVQKEGGSVGYKIKILFTT
jgi:hypothetical protein